MAKPEGVGVATEDDMPTKLGGPARLMHDATLRLLSGETKGNAILHLSVDLAAVSNGKQMNDILLSIKRVDDPIVAGAQSAAVLTFQPVVRKRAESKTHFVDLVFDSRLDFGRQFEKRRIEGGIIDLECSRHRRSGLARAGTEAIGDLSLGLLDALFELRSELQLVLDQIVKSLTDLTQFSLRKLLQFRLDLLDLAHRGMMHRSTCEFKEHRGIDQDRGVEDRSDNGVSFRTSRTSASIWVFVSDVADVTFEAIRSQILRHLWDHVKRSIASATRSCSSIGRALTWSTIDCARESTTLPIIRSGRLPQVDFVL
jgi:hypothetical protein